MPKRVPVTGAGKATGRPPTGAKHVPGASFHWRHLLDLRMQKIVESMTLGAVGTILLRTARGRDWKRAPFAPYSRAYAATRAERGLTVKRVDLRATGGMLGSLGLRGVRVSGKSATLLIAPDAAITGGGSVPNNLKARYLEARGRVFMGLNRADLKRIWDHTNSETKLTALRG